MRPLLLSLGLGLFLLALFLGLAAALYAPSPPPNAEAPATTQEPDGLEGDPIVGGGDYIYLGFVWHLDQPYVRMPETMALGAYSVFWCESRFRDGAVGLAGERGVPQISPIHRPAMAKAGLDFEDGKDRMEWAINLFEKHGWRPWSCQP